MAFFRRRLIAVLAPSCMRAPVNRSHAVTRAENEHFVCHVNGPGLKPKTLCMQIRNGATVLHRLLLQYVSYMHTVRM